MNDAVDAAALDALRARGAARRDPVRWRLIEAMARRAARHGDATRARLATRLAQLVTEADAALAAPEPPPRQAASTPSALRPLLERLGAPRADAPATAELKAVQQHRGTWSRLGLERRLAQVQATVPDNAGPLNTQRLLHQALSALNDASPAYLARLVAQVDGLLWLDQAAASAAPPAPRRARR